MKLTLKATLIGAALLAVSGAGLAIAGSDSCHMHGAKMGGAPHGYMRSLQQLDLSNEQQEQLQALVTTQKSQMKEQRQDMRDKREALREAIQNNADDATIQKLAETMGGAVTARIIQSAEMKKQVDAILTAEQREELAAMPKPECGGCGHHGKHHW
jgi:Spy/CpxP family protein refolding chaperone